MSIFNTYTNAQAKESIAVCKELLTKIYEKGNIPFNEEDANVLNQSISTLYLLLCDAALEWRTTPVCCALVKAQAKLQTQKIRNESGIFEVADKRVDLQEAIGYVDDTLKLLSQNE